MPETAKPYTLHNGHVNLKDELTGDVFAIEESEYLERAQDPYFAQRNSLLSEDERHQILDKKRRKAEYGTGLDAVAAGGAGVFRGVVPFGDEILQGLGVSEERLQSYDELHPVSTFVGEAAGTVGSLVIGGGALRGLGAISKLSKASRAARTGLALGGGALEGGFATLTQEAKQWSLYDEKISAGDLMQGMAIGGALNLVTFGIGSVLKHTGNSITGGALKSKEVFAGVLKSVDDDLGKLAMNDKAIAKEAFKAIDDIVETHNQTIRQYDEAIALNSKLRSQVRGMHKAGVVPDDELLNFRSSGEAIRSGLAGEKKVLENAIGDIVTNIEPGNVRQLVNRYQLASRGLVKSNSDIITSLAPIVSGAQHVGAYALGGEVGAMFSMMARGVVWKGMSKVMGGGVAGQAIGYTLGTKAMNTLGKITVPGAKVGKALWTTGKFGAYKLMSNEDLDTLKTELAMAPQAEAVAKQLIEAGMDKDDAIEMASKNKVVIDFLKGKLPVGKKPDVLERRKFTQYWNAVSQPVGILENMAQLKLTSVDMEVAEALVPRELAELRKTVRESIAEETESYSSVQRSQQELFLGQSIGVGVSDIQAAFAEKNKKQKGQSAPKIANKYQTRLGETEQLG